GTCLSRRRRVMVELGPGACPRSQPAHGPAGARLAGGRSQGAVAWSRASSALDHAARAGIHDDLVTPGATAERLGWTHEAISGPNRPGVWTLSGRRPRAWRHV